MENRNTVNPWGAVLKRLNPPEYGHVETRTKTGIRTRVPLHENSRCLWPFCLKLSKAYEPADPQYGDSRFALCHTHHYTVFQLGFEIGMQPRDAEGKPVMYADKQYNPKPSENGYIYYIRVGDAIKIGFAKSLSSRLAQYPPNAQFIMSHPGTRSDEKMIHSLLSARRTHGREWYEDHAEVREFMAGQAQNLPCSTRDPRKRRQTQVGQHVRPKPSVSHRG